MITLWLREHGTHNNGISIDFEADLDNYSDSESLIEDLFEYTREELEDQEIAYWDKDRMEEWLITNYEFEDDTLSFDIDEYSDIEALIKVNESLKDLDNSQLKLVHCLIEDGSRIEDAISKVADEDLYYFEGSVEEFVVMLVEEGSFGEIPESIASYIDYDKLGRDLTMTDYTYNESKNIVYSNH